MEGGDHRELTHCIVGGGETQPIPSARSPRSSRDLHTGKAGSFTTLSASQKRISEEVGVRPS